MNTNNEKKTSGEVFTKTITLADLQNKWKDNLFSANHRNAMVSRYGYTEAMRMTIGDLND